MDPNLKKQNQKGEMGIIGFLKAIWPFLKKQHGKLVVLLITISVGVAYKLTVGFVSKPLIDAITERKPITYLITIVVTVFCIFMFNLFFGVLQDRILSKLIAIFLFRTRSMMLSKLQRLPYKDISKFTHGDLLARFSSDLTAMEKVLLKHIPALLLNTITLLIAVILLFILEWKITLILLLLLPFPFLFTSKLGRKVTQASYLRKQHEAEVLHEVEENNLLNAVQRIFSLEKYLMKKFEKLLIIFSSYLVRSTFYTLLFRRVNILSGELIFLIIIMLAGFFLYSNQIVVGTLVAFVTMLALIVGVIEQISQALAHILSATGGMRRVVELLSMTMPSVAVDQRKTLNPLQDRILFENVTFGYTNQKMALKQIQLEVKKNTSVALVGKSGSGKSTLLNVLLRLYDPQHGSVDWDGINTLNVTEKALHEEMTIVPQAPLLFDVSIRENLLMGRVKVNENEMIQAAKLAEIHDAIMNLPQGYDTIVRNHGENLSGGQCQRIAIARALIRNPSVLLLDEITSALDPLSETAINKTINQLRHQMTMIQVTHKLSAVAGVHKIYVFDQGKIIESGTHLALLQKDGFYKALWNKQSAVNVSLEGLDAQVKPEYLGTIPLFDGIDLPTLTQITKLFSTANYQSKQVIIKKGEIGHQFFLIARGSVEIIEQTSEGDHKLVLEEGDYFGEVALLKDVPRTATVFTKTYCTFLVLNKDSFNQMIQQTPSLYDALRKKMENRI